jgi:putative chitinase
MDRAKFYAALRASRLFGKSLPQKAVAGMDHLLDVQQRYLPDMNMDELAINLATAFHETAATMQPITERGAKSYFRKYEPGTKLGKVLGNTQAGDGYRFRGEGHVQNTGRRNARVATDRLNALFGLGVDLVKNPEMRGDPLVSALSLFVGCREGWWTGKGWGDFLDGVDESDEEDLREFIRSRAVVNGTDKARRIGEHALAFEAALKLAGFASAAPAAGKIYTDSTIVRVVQEKLTALGYREVGGIDGSIGTQTRAGILAFRADNGLPLVPIIDDGLLAALDRAKPRKLAPERENAAPDLVREKVPEAKASWWSRVVAAIVGLPSLIFGAFGGLLENFGTAQGMVQPVKDVLGEVPGWVWFLLIAGAALLIYRQATRGERAAVDAFRSGARR